MSRIRTAVKCLFYILALTTTSAYASTDAQLLDKFESNTGISAQEYELCLTETPSHLACASEFSILNKQAADALSGLIAARNASAVGSKREKALTSKISTFLVGYSALGEVAVSNL